MQRAALMLRSRRGARGTPLVVSGAEMPYARVTSRLYRPNMYYVLEKKRVPVLGDWTAEKVELVWCVAWSHRSRRAAALGLGHLFCIRYTTRSARSTTTETHSTTGGDHDVDMTEAAVAGARAG